MKLAAFLDAQGIKKGDVLIVVGEMHSNNIVTFYACATIGVIVVRV